MKLRVFLAGSSVVVEIEAPRSEFECEGPNSFRVVNIVRLTENAPKIGELKIGKLHAHEKFSLAVTNVGTGVRIVL